MALYNPQGHRPHRPAHEHHARGFQLPQTEERLERLENDFHTLTRLIFSARHADNQDQQTRRAATPTQDQKELWNWTANHPFDASPNLSTGAKTTWSRGQPIKFTSPKQTEQQPGAGSVGAKLGGKRPAKMRRCLFAVAIAVFCSIAVWFFLGGEAAFGDLYRAAEWLKETVVETCVGAQRYTMEAVSKKE
ncbi:hypothetical protein MCOR27_003155 [Pyricularia oryzae]|uniref:Uncharacterized protein n=2 Tax=Pyricularia TaxID=48558 RepID=A0ABQ8NT72_PYRGI|nr:hypothetical protein MCOR01_008803 [Pyricularia oryzae]KAI6301787.1 hypothetical protein MCOR33_002771 [Pyricularia grisea]KAI6254753.1 hypothetical protein MCOR19_008755 [Pyricularia oryzae]KAI6273761.1 hypothetical protein MCOR26_006767 [Pyricularia oryzae]KAI6283628.1 hypothetical protein MCOR27_003155 [Pyricularia oryzae]